MDSFNKNQNDDFQFKPLTEGLGFHKKSMELRDEMLQALPTKTGILPKSKSIPPQNQSLTTPPPAAVAWNAELTNKNFLEKSSDTIKLVSVSSNWAASFFDMAMVSGLTLLFSSAVFVLSQIDVSILVGSIQSDWGIQTAAVAVVFAVLEIYTVTCRTFFGKTLGEWVFDSRLGTPAEQSSFFYPFKVAWRTFVICLTGFFVLPVLSSAIGEDLAGIISGTQLYSEKR